MGTWMCHLRLAENLLERIPNLDPFAFAVGSIVPDSGIPDENWENFTPPKEVSHFLTDAHPWKIADLDFCRRYLDGEETPDLDPARFSFLLGYYFHLVTDNLWHSAIGIPTKAKFESFFAGEPEAITEVKRDWYGLDFLYLRERPDSFFHRVFLGCTYETDHLDFMPPEAVQERLSYIGEFYQRTDERVQALFDRPYTYLSRTRMDLFIDETTEILDWAYRYLFVQSGPSGGETTVLHLLSQSIGTNS